MIVIAEKYSCTGCLRSKSRKEMKISHDPFHICEKCFGSKENLENADYRVEMKLVRAGGKEKPLLPRKQFTRAVRDRIKALEGK